MKKTATYCSRVCAGKGKYQANPALYLERSQQGVEARRRQMLPALAKKHPDVPMALLVQIARQFWSNGYMARVRYEQRAGGRGTRA